MINGPSNYIEYKTAEHLINELVMTKRSKRLLLDCLRYQSKFGILKKYVEKTKYDKKE